MNLDCAAFERWLDEGRPAAGARAMRAHAEGCARCARALAAALELDAALARPALAAAPADFTATVMRRVRQVRLARAAAGALPVTPALAWWVRVAADPVTALALVLAAGLLWGREPLWALAAALSHRLTALGSLSLDLPGAARVTIEAPAAIQAFTSPTVLLGLGVALVPVVLWASWSLYRWSEHAFAAPFARRLRAQ